MSTIQIVAVVLLGVSMFPLIWSAVCVIISRFGGWNKLAAAYRTRQPFEGTLHRFQSARMQRQARYKGCLDVGANASGLYLSPYFPFRPGHPPLFVPWGDVTVRQDSGAGAWDLRFREVPEVPLRLSAQLVTELEAEAGRGWPLASAEQRAVSAERGQ